MKVLFLNSSACRGGAAKAAVSLFRVVRHNGVTSELFTQEPADGGMLQRCISWIRPRLDTSPLLFYPKRTGALFSPSLLPERLTHLIKGMQPDLIHLHWIQEGFVRIETLGRFNLPIIWTIHDSWPFTGGCHLPFECERYKDSCGSCPVLGSTSERDLSRWVFKRKKQAWKNLDITVVSPSRWLARCAQESALFGGRRIEVIPNGLDLSIFQMTDKQAARNSLGLSEQSKILLFSGANGLRDYNKGFHHLRSALADLVKAGYGSSLELVIAGSEVQDDLPDLGVKTSQFGYVSDEHMLNSMYCAADVVVVPSQQENLPNTIMEAMGSGTPCVAFNIGGVPDLIDHLQNGYLSQPYDGRSLMDGIVWCLEQNGTDYKHLSRNARLKIESEFSIDCCSRKYLRLYQELAGTEKPPPI